MEPPRNLFDFTITLKPDLFFYTVALPYQIAQVLNIYSNTYLHTYI